MKSLFSSSFPATDKSAWLTQVQQELKDTGTYESMRWHTDDGFTLDPYYTADDLTHLPLAIIQGAQKQLPGWLNAPERLISSEKADNLLLRDALTRGADALVLTLVKKPDVSVLLNGIKLSEIPVFFRSGNELSGIDLVDLVQSLKTSAPYQWKGGLLAETSDATAEITRQTADSPLFRTVCVNSHGFHNAGATITQELAFTLAMLVDTYDKLTDTGLPIDQLITKTMLSVSVGTSYFPEIAKLRALRVLMSRLLSAYSISASLHHSYGLHCQTSIFYDSVVTPYTNLLRATTEAMAAVIGGCDALTIHPYKAVSGKLPDNFDERIARNISVLLKEESYFDKVADPSAGSYYIENLTNQLAESAWGLFLEVEKKGGYEKAMHDGFIQTEIERSYQAKREAVRNGKVLVGVTKFRSDEENTKADQPTKATKNPPGTLPNRRLAGEFE